MNFIKVKNKKGTSDRNPPAGYTSWLDFWEKEKNRKAVTCLIFGCQRNVDVGGHVFKVGEGPKEYILPMCYSCNNKPDGEIFIVREEDLAPITRA